MAPTRRTPPPPLEGNDRLITAVITAGWAVALIVVLSVRGSLPANERWWVWTCAFGLGMGLFGLWYVPFLKRHRARLAARRAQLDEVSEVSEVSEVGGVSGPATDSGAVDSGAVDSGYVSRDSGSNVVSSTETPGRSTKS